MCAAFRQHTVIRHAGDVTDSALYGLCVWPVVHQIHPRSVCVHVVNMKVVFTPAAHLVSA